MRIAIAAIVLAGLSGQAAAQVSTPVLTQPPAWQKKLSVSKTLAADDARARGRAAFLAGKSPEALIAEIRAAHPKGGDEVVAAALKEARVTGKAEVDRLTEAGETEAQQLQAAMDRLSKMEAALSNLLKKMAETQSSVTRNLK